MIERRKTPADDVRAFRKKYGLTQMGLNNLLGFSSDSAAVGRWERTGAPYYATLIFHLIEVHGIDLLRSLAAKGISNASRFEVQAFRERHGLFGVHMDRLFGLSSEGRATRRWEDPMENGAPNYITIMMAYCDEFGCDTLKAKLDEGKNDK